MQKFLLPLACGLALAFTSHAQTINQRVDNQRARIAAGRADGQLNQPPGPPAARRRPRHQVNRSAPSAAPTAAASLPASASKCKAS